MFSFLLQFLSVFLMDVVVMDPYATNPGPVDSSILYDQDKHVSSAVWEGQVQLPINKSLINFYLFTCVFSSEKSFQ